MIRFLYQLLVHGLAVVGLVVICSRATVIEPEHRPLPNPVEEPVPDNRPARISLLDPVTGAETVLFERE